MDKVNKNGIVVINIEIVSFFIREKIEVVRDGNISNKSNYFDNQIKVKVI